ncbi:lytic transglycosylase domain-containing protein [Leifsonia shinshuensis]|uniref:lytic transglycosylase domain-containing protein n=1 Tax=Leifsonia shinshuensis TaxID=150026 RepID=UPI001F5134E5|nr:lytic transglycosylase domain-containing protein [Leifsonia shinshuensis]MCI0157006.1 lytic transglycosylase domain-containing protein [Leifsonia shinshuensis]
MMRSVGVAVGAAVLIAVAAVTALSAAPPPAGWSIAPTASDPGTIAASAPAGAATRRETAAAAASAIADRVDQRWAVDVSRRTGVAARAVMAYSGAAIAIASEQPGCRLGWSTLAGLAAVESHHGTSGGSSVGPDGRVSPPIFGPDLDGGSYDAVADTDGGALDGDPSGDRAVGPFQFLPSTWRTWGADGNGDGVADPQQLDDAALAAGRMLCSYGDLSRADRWRAAIYGYNHVDSYVDAVASAANAIAAEAR